MTPNERGDEMRGVHLDSTERVNLRCSSIVFRNQQILLLRRERDGRADWVLPGGTPRPGESAASCARREVAEETGLQISVDRVAFVLEASNPADGSHLLDLVFTTTEGDRTAEPQEIEPGLRPIFYPLDRLAGLRLRPPITGYLRGLHLRGRRGEGAYLGNVWRPADQPSASDPAIADG